MTLLPRIKRASCHSKVIKFLIHEGQILLKILYLSKDYYEAQKHKN